MDKYTCKRCGGTIEVESGKTVGICDSCGRPQNVPRDQSDEVTKMYNKANRLRQVEKDYDAAKIVYEEILNNDPEEPEANWGVVLCQYGIQYADDPLTKQKVPTLNRMQSVSIFDNAFYKKAVGNSSDPETYQKDAHTIDSIQKRYHEVAASEKPYDVFISYKDRIDGTDQKTEDYEVAKKLYETLMDKGLRVFFSDRTLKGKAVGEYEPYIFSALESSKYMLVVGSKSEYFNAEWVKNEWSRYLQQINNGAGKKIVPVYHHCSISEIPTELIARNQAYDYSDIGAMSGLLGIIERDCVRSKQPAFNQTAGNPETANLKQRIFIALNSNDWTTADRLTNQVLEMEPAYAEGYLVKIMLERRCSERKDLGKDMLPLNKSRHYKNLMQFADDDLTAEIQQIELQITANIKKKKKKKLIIAGVAVGLVAAFIIAIVAYVKIIRPSQKLSEAKDLLEAGQTEEAYAILDKLGQSEMVKDSKYDIAKESLEKGDYDNAYSLLVELGDYKDSAEILNNSKFERGNEFLRNGDYDGAYALLEQIGNYQDADVIVSDSKFDRAGEYAGNGEYTEAIALYDELGDYKDSAGHAAECRRAFLEIQLNAGDYLTAYRLYLELGEDEAAAALAEEYPWVEIATAEPGDSVFFGHYEQDNDKSNGKEDVEWFVLDVKADKVLLVSRFYLEKQPYNSTPGTTNWEMCTLRSWMNDEMYNTLFDEDEKNRVMLSNVSSKVISAPAENDRHNGNDTEDRLFLLSYDEYYEYQAFLPNTDRTSYALAEAGNGMYDLGDCYWLRTMISGGNPYKVSSANSDSPRTGTWWGCECTAGIRPAFWFDLGSLDVQVEDTESADVEQQ